ncbi:F-box only protein 43 [Dissostichus eleginoides]|uniref:F-box only protein 43 n=1 Tax=Dissostichus eleginoides TaxID=100907 RepID=A0AAD9C883_DISEL|nr:F-box only protein 43 [Dissostichus eleginoides]
MQCTPESKVFLESLKEQQCFDDCADSGYSGLFHSPQSLSAVLSALSPVEFSERPKEKENLWLAVTPKENTREAVELLAKDSRVKQWPTAVNWCETPKVYKRDASLRHRLLLSKPSTDKTDNTRSPCSRRTESPIRVKSEHWLSASLDSLDTVAGAFASSTLKSQQDLPLSGRKCRILFTQVRTSTVEDGKLNSGNLSNFEGRGSLTDADFSESISASDQGHNETSCFMKSLPASSKENSQSPVSHVANNLYDSSSGLYTPSSSHTPKYIRSVCEDSGFSSLALDKSQDSSVDHDGSFLELLLLSASRGSCDTPNLAEARRRSRLQRQHRLSTLREGGSQSEDDPAERKQDRLYSRSKEDEVFADGATPRSLVHAMCQQKAHMFFGQSPSLKEQLKSTAALAETPVTFRTTMPLAGLIGRKMGLRKVDILSELKERNLRHILALVLSHLTPHGIYRCGQVCKKWNEIIQQDKRASFKRRSHLREMEAALEHGGGVHVPDADTRLALLKRSALKTVQAQSRSFSFCTPQSANSTLTPSGLSTLNSGSSHKRDKFLEVAKTLFNDESLKPCPRCQSPARCHSVKREGVCSTADCAFQFCSACLCAFHGSRECGSQSAGRRRKDIILPGSAQSKRNVRRL